MTRVTALLTCHNRKDKTVQCLESLFEAASFSGMQFAAVLVDDGSNDGTADAVRGAFPAVEVVRGDGNLFWNRGMHRAQLVAIKDDPDFLLWVNDDTVLLADALMNLLCVHARAKAEHDADVVVVGATVDAETRVLTYGGLVPVSSLRRFNYVRVPISSSVQECQAMNGNIVLVPRAVYSQVGTVDPVFEHALGDIDYALQVRGAGFSILVAPGAQGLCSANSKRGTHFDDTLPMHRRWKQFIGRKGLPTTSWRHFVKRHARGVWVLYFLYPYINFATHIALGEVARWARSVRGN